NLAEGALVIDPLRQQVQFAIAPLFDEFAPDPYKLFRAGGRLDAGETMTHEKRKRLLDRSLGTVPNLVEIRILVAVLDHRRKIRGDAAHPAGADRFHARLLDRFEDSARGVALWQHAFVKRRVMASELERRRVRL